MAALRPLLPPEPLPRSGAAIEHATFDAKARADLTKPFHLAKDVAAFANHLGGNIVIGVPEDKGVLLAPVPLTPKEAADTRNAFSKEVAKRCSPPPLIDFGEYPMGAGFVVTVVVFPYVGQPVGVRVNADMAKGGYGGEAFAFPLRVGADTSYLEPEQLSMLMLPDYRRVVVALGAIPAGARVKLHLLAAPAHGIGIAKASFGEDEAGLERAADARAVGRARRGAAGGREDGGDQRETGESWADNHAERGYTACATSVLSRVASSAAVRPV
jgi:hypothetical protein